MNARTCGHRTRAVHTFAQRYVRLATTLPVTRLALPPYQKPLYPHVCRIDGRTCAADADHAAIPDSLDFGGRFDDGYEIA